MKKYILIFMIFCLSGCTLDVLEKYANLFRRTGLIVTNQSPNWELIPNTFGSVTPLKFRNKTYPEIIVQIEIGATLFRDYLSRSSCKNKKTNVFIINFYIISDGKIVTKESIAFNPAKYYFIKNNKKIDIIIDNSLYFLRGMKWMDDYYDVTKLFKIKGCAVVDFASPLVCGELENVEMVFDGFIVNDKPLSPIKVHFRYEDPQSIPLYSPEEK